MHVLFSAAMVAAIIVASPLAAETPAPFPDFSAKRVGVPKSGTKRLTVQIDPAEQAAVLDRMARREPPEIVTPAPSPELNPDGSIRRDIGSYGWFWKRISPALSDSGPGRLFSAMDVITGIGEVPQPRLQHMQNIARTNGIDILRKRVHRHENFDIVSHKSIDRVVVGMVEFFEPAFPLIAGEAFVPRNRDSVRYSGNDVGALRLTVQVDQEPRDDAHHSLCFEDP